VPIVAPNFYPEDLHEKVFLVHHQPSPIPIMPAAIRSNAGGKRKRVKKNRRRTTAAQSEESDLSSSSDSEVERTPSVAKTVDRRAAAKEEIASSSSSSSSSESSDEETSQAPIASEKRHRKRTRKGKVEKAQDVNIREAANHTTAAGSASITTPKDIEQIKSLPDPSEDQRLNDTTIASLAYAQQYHINRIAWKFNKARQEHLIRHMTSRLDETKGDKVMEADGKEQNEVEDEIDKPSGWPDEWNCCVGLYLYTVQGAAKERLVQRLRQSAQKRVPDVVVEKISTAPDQVQAADNSIAKSVSFGDMAMGMSQDQDDSQPASSKVTVEERDRIQFERERARTLLTIMHQSFY
jgi:hypothetical protein